jgi:hypothetical protein
MDETIQKLRAEARRLTRGKVPRAVRYPAAFRAAAVALIRSRCRRGLSRRRVAQELGLQTQSLTRWLQEPVRPVLRPVAVRVEPEGAGRAGASPVLITPQGVRVEGLDPEGLIAVLRALG